MDRMLDENLHISLPEADVTAFFSAELRSYLRSLEVTRRIEHVDGSMTEHKARQNQLTTVILNNMAEDGLRAEIPQARLTAIPHKFRDEAAALHHDMYKEFLSSEFNADIQQRATAQLGRPSLTNCDQLLLRKAALDARIAAHSALEAASSQSASQARATALELLSEMPSSRQSVPDPAKKTAQSLATPAIETPKAKKCLSEGVDLIDGRVTALAIYHQRDQALNQPTSPEFDGFADSPIIDREWGADLFGTAVRMIRQSRSQKDTCLQQLKSVSLFIYITGVQIVTDIRQHHLEMFGKALEHQVPKHYWKSDAQKDLTFKELLEVNRNLPKAGIGLASSTIARHLTTLTNIIRFADGENNKAAFIPNTANLVPCERRSDSEKRSVYTLKDAQKVFQHPLWQGCKSKGRRHTEGTVVIKDHHYWINLILAYTGARRSEIAGLLESDIGQDADIHFLHIRENRLRGLKNRFSQRRIPLHPHLIELGFLEFVEEIRISGNLVLFPEAIPAKIRAELLNAGSATPPYDKKFGDSLDHVWRACLNRSLDGNPEKYCLASLRGFVNDTLINLRKQDGITMMVPDIDRRDILGHRPSDVNEANYRRDEKPLGPLNIAICLLPRLF